MMKKKIESFIDDLKSNKKLSSFDEASTKQAVVLRLLSFLGWNIFDVDEVYPDYAANSHGVSYALRVKNTNKLFIEVKRVHEKLDNHQKRLVNMASRENVSLSILTNGILWWFYLTSEKSDWQQKWFYSADLLKQKPDAIVPKLIDLLSKQKVAKGQSLRTAKVLYQDKKQKMAADFVPQAWNQILKGPNKIFVELLSDTTEKICGYEVNSNLIEKFLKEHLDNWVIKDLPGLTAAPPAQIKEVPIVLKNELANKPAPSSSTSSKASSTGQFRITKKHESYEGKTIKSFTFNGRTEHVNHWEEVLTNLCDYFATTHQKDFEKVLWISGENKTYFSRYKDQLRIPEKIKKTDIFVETKLTPDEIVKTSKALLEEFGYTRDLLKVTTK
jgi:predicted type IV restriction endonuclease